MGKGMIKVGVKYCGGCNPRYDRAAFLREAQEKYQDIATFEAAKEDVLYDRLLVISGCTSACANYQHLRYLGEPIMVWEEGHMDRLESLREVEKETISKEKHPVKE